MRENPSCRSNESPTGYAKRRRGENTDWLRAFRKTRATEFAYAVSSVAALGFHNAGPLDEMNDGTMGTSPPGVMWS